MQITRIRLQDFRNYKDQEAEFHPQVNLIAGDNAQGKTNLLESIYVASLGRSFRTPKDKEMIRFDRGFSVLRAAFDGEEGERQVEIRLLREGKKEIRVDKVRVERLSDMMDRFYVVVFSPEDLKIVKEEPEKRRNFIDRELCRLSLSYLHHLVAYKKTLMQRNALLRTGNPDRDSLGVWDDALAGYGAQIIHRRENFLRDISRISSDIHSQITQGKETLDLSYLPSVSPADEPEETKRRLMSRLLQTRGADLRQGSTSAGPHKDDVQIDINGVQARAFGSQGQQRTAALSMKLAEIRLIEIEKGEKPVLLLDDVLSELDHDRQKYLIRSLSGSQLFITAAELSEELLGSLPQGFSFAVEQGKIDRK